MDQKSKAMRVPTVTVKHKASGRVLVVNENDWANGNIPGVDMGSGWDRIGESHGDSDTEKEAVETAKAQREMVENQAKKAPDIEKKAAAAAKTDGNKKKAVDKKETGSK